MNSVNSTLEIGILVLCLVAVAEFIWSIYRYNAEIKRLRRLTAESKEELELARKEYLKFLELVNEKQTNPGIRDTTETLH